MRNRLRYDLNMKIKLTKKSTMATCLAGAPASNQFHMKAVLPKGAQHVGTATVWSDGIVVTTCSGRLVGKAKTKDEAKQMIHEFHKASPMYLGFEKELA
jgi:predicted house-cleaning NTP pyrophosphatase (Maf/HAM1 superfamily)